MKDDRRFQKRPITGAFSRDTDESGANLNEKPNWMELLDQLCQEVAEELEASEIA